MVEESKSSMINSQVLYLAQDILSAIPMSSPLSFLGGSNSNLGKPMSWEMSLSELGGVLQT